MKSRTSFSKLTTFKKDLTRYAPIWALYFIGMMMVLLDLRYYDDYDRFAYSVMGDLVSSFGIVNIIYAGVIAVMLFGDLYNTRMCYSLHTIPMRRETMLLSHLASGILFSLVPNAVASLYLMLRLEGLWYLALYWLLAATLQFIFFYGLAAASALLTGNRFAMLAVYAGFNFVSMLIYAVLETIYAPMLTGVVVDLGTFTRFSPVVHLVDQFKFFKFESYQVTVNEGINEYIRTHYKYLGLGDGWGYTAILGGLGIVAMTISVGLYRLRHLECAGDFVAFPRTKGVACVIITLCVALCFALVGETISDGYILWMAVGLVVGFFGSLMLLERRVKVFRKKTFAGFGVLALAVIISFVAVTCDWFGIVHWTPEADQVKSVTISNYKSSSYSYDDYYYGNRIRTTLTEKEEIADIIEAHEDILARLEEAEDRYEATHYIVLTYTLNSGRTVTRAYSAPANGVNYEIISKYFYTPEQIMGIGTMSWEEYVQGISYLYAEGFEIQEECYGMLLEAMWMDCKQGAVNTNGGGNTKFYVELNIDSPEGMRWRSLYITEDAVNTIALLKKPEIILGYTDWDSFVGSVTNISTGAGEFAISQADFAELLEALKLDAENGAILSGYKYGYEDILCEIVVADMYGNCRYLYLNKYSTNSLTWLVENGYLEYDLELVG